MNIVKELVDLLKQPDKKPSGYDSEATVRRVEGDTLWVHIAGGVDETPIKRTIDAKENDVIQVRVSNGTAFAVGNSSAPPTDDTRANLAYDNSENARMAAEGAIDDANRARKAAESAEADAVIAKESAKNASEYATNALVGLSTVESVVEAVNWISQHGTMTLTSDTHIDPSHVYFIRDENGDYTVGSYKYSVVSEPKTEDLSSYYELSIDKSVQNYVMTHVAVDGEGLWLIPDTAGNKVLIATGAGSSYQDAGTYVIGEVGNIDYVVAKFVSGESQIGSSSETHVVISDRAFKMYDSDEESGTPYVWLSDLRNDEGVYTTEETFTRSTLGNQRINLNFTKIEGSETISVGGETITRETFTFYPESEPVYASPMGTNNYVTFNSAPEANQTCVVTYYDASDGQTKTATFTTDGTTTKYLFAFIASRSLSGASVRHVVLNNAEVFGVAWNGTSAIIDIFGGYIAEGDVFSVGYSTTSNLTKAYTLGKRAVGSTVGAMSFVTGSDNEASGVDSIATGSNTTAKGEASFTEGSNTTATGSRAHAEGNYTEANGVNSHAEGYRSQSNNSASHAEGNYTEANGQYSHAEGNHCVANGTACHAGGDHTIASGLYQTAIGQYNIEHPSSDNIFFVVGNGGSGGRSDAFLVDKFGNAGYANSIYKISDRRAKEHIDYLGEDAVEFVRSLKPVHYIKDGGHHVGFYAQDVNESDKWDCMTGEMNGYMTLEYTELIAPLVTYVQKLEKRIEELEKATSP